VQTESSELLPLLRAVVSKKKKQLFLHWAMLKKTERAADLLPDNVPFFCDIIYWQDT